MVGVPAPAAVSTANAHLPETSVFAACARTAIDLRATIAATAIAFSQPDVVSISAPHVLPRKPRAHESHESHENHENLVFTFSSFSCVSFGSCVSWLRHCF